MTPEESVKAFEDLHAKVLYVVHNRTLGIAHNSLDKVWKVCSKAECRLRPR
jgi:hypothetical protein